MLQAPYKILLVEDLDQQATLITDAIARVKRLHLAFRVRDALEALAYLRGEGEYADRKRFPLPEIVMLDLSAPNSGNIEVRHWAQRRTLRPAFVAFATPDRAVDSAVSEQLLVDLYEPNIWQDHVFERFLLFTGNIAEAKRREKSDFAAKSSV